MTPQTIIQMAFVVKDLREGVHRWIRTTGAGPFFVIDKPIVQDPLYLGAPCAADYAVAAGYSGTVQIELIEVRNRAPSMFSKLIEDQGEGYHHFMPAIPDYDAAVAAYAAEGCPVVFSGSVPGVGRVAFADGGSKFGGYIEIVEPSAIIARMHDLMRGAAADWDGGDPIRPFPLP